MKLSKEKVENAILFFAKIYGKELNYKAIIDTDACLPKMVEMVVYEMFLQKFNSYYCSDDQYEQYKIIYEFATELKEKGWVDFE